MEKTLEYALISFINERPEGNMLRDIAIRTLKDINSRRKVTYIDQPVLRPVLSNTPPEVYWLRKKVKRLLPSIPYKKLKRCRPNFKKL